MTEHGLRTEDDRFWPTSEEQKHINQRRESGHTFWVVAVLVAVAMIVLAGILVGS